jgi:protein-tyrosine-phosphatase
MCPEAKEKVFYLREFEKNAKDDAIPDPIGRGAGFYQNVMDSIKRSIKGFIEWLAK